MKTVNPAEYSLAFVWNNCKNLNRPKRLTTFVGQWFDEQGDLNRNAGHFDEPKRSPGSSDRYRDRGIRDDPRQQTRKTPKTPKTLETLETLRYPPRQANFRAHSKITARFEGQLYHHLWLLLNCQILTVAHYSSGLAQSGAAKSNATLTLKTAHLFLSEPLIGKTLTHVSPGSLLL